MFRRNKIEQKTLAFEPFEYRYYPHFRGRINVLRYYSMQRRSFSAGDEGQNWTRYQRLLLHSLEVPGGHPFSGWWERFHETNPEAKERFLKWGKIVPIFSWRPNLGYGLWEIGFPRVSMSRAINDLKLAAENNVISLFFDSVWNHWATQGPHYYMLARMTWNPNADGEAILEDYYQRGFGKAADHVRDYWTQMEEANEKNMFDGYSWLDIYDEGFFDAAEDHLDRAMDAVGNEPEKYGDRIEFVKMGLNYARTIVEVKHLMDRFRASDGAETEAEDRARQIWFERIRPMMTCDKHPYAFSSSRRPGHSRGFRGLGLFPADLENRW